MGAVPRDGLMVASLSAKHLDSGTDVKTHLIVGNGADLDDGRGRISRELGATTTSTAGPCRRSAASAQPLTKVDLIGLEQDLPTE